MLSKDEKEKLVKEELLEAISYYIGRQKIVAQAMTDLGLDVTTKFNSKTPLEGNELEKFKKWSEQRSKIPSRGTWVDKEGNKWEYFLHGEGCLLTNIETGEPIEWDIPQTDSFDPYFFHDNLFWQFKAESRYDKVGSVRHRLTELVNQLIEELIEEGKITKDYSLPNKENN